VASERNPLTLEDREEISRGLAKGLENKDIATSIGRVESVVFGEGGGRTALHRLIAATKRPRTACYRASWQPPGPDSHRQATTSLRTRRTTMHYVTVSSPFCLAYESPRLTGASVSGDLNVLRMLIS
jgi:hypothetical protein